MIDMNDFSLNLRKLMAQRGFNQVELARLSGVRQQYISRYLNEDPQGKAPRDIETLLALCRALNCNLYTLTGILELRDLEGGMNRTDRLSAKAIDIATRFDALPKGDSRRNEVEKILGKLR